eukprot:Gregarina_sp_Poly_1__7688@NODE_432_length_8476_cov_39_955524_g352_i0_p5_GENE_NODE_432_length_8476_cov_39_955524_g352_i0NODE_432_length_8476_cov_39_955524_g352_i0_p5_ORF_typecomplete_len308_score40_18Methyltransf_23/PF13489_6/1e16Methyltransf_31/PF13847_6/9_1e10Methyltransf_12/PF08242_12/1_1e09Methyltransf_25/PF13649_6/2_5e07MTS/PF05175_14/3_9e05MTS/PF05175_14/5_1e03Methyltransf_11/PF08241_12/0_00014Ubie_methyltran/PF01209_18/0_00025Methyltransf_2/PF00891_18/0_00017Methyltransf_20/PF12147_8/0_000
MDFVDNYHVSKFELTDELKAELGQIIADDNVSLPSYWINKYKQEQQKNWNLFYKRNASKFFKDRSWLDREFGQSPTDIGEDDASGLALNSLDNTGDSWILIDFGCGTGNALFPILSSHPKCRACAFDVSPRAIELVQSRYSEEQRTGGLEVLGVWDLINDSSPTLVLRRNSQTNQFDLCKEAFCELGDAGFLLFVLSAIPPENVKTVLFRVWQKLKNGGILMFRDYARFDHKEIRFAQRKRSKLEDHLYVRQDGTLAAYFDKDELTAILEGVGFKVLCFDLIQRKFRNRKTDQTFMRCWLQGVFQKR